MPADFCRPSRAQRADIRDSSLARGRVAFRKVIDEFAESDLAGGITHSCQTACRANTTAESPPSLGARAVNRPIQDRREGPDQNSAGKYPLISRPMQISTRIGVVQAIDRLP